MDESNATATKAQVSVTMFFARLGTACLVFSGLWDLSPALKVGGGVETLRIQIQLNSIFLFRVQLFWS